LPICCVWCQYVSPASCLLHHSTALTDTTVGHSSKC
jgi:hypothetical protein